MINKEKKLFRLIMISFIGVEIHRADCKDIFKKGCYKIFNYKSISGKSVKKHWDSQFDSKEDGFQVDKDLKAKVMSCCGD
jgi:hypothetical protein